MNTVETGTMQSRTGDMNAFDLRGLVQQCANGNADWLERISGYVRTQMNATARTSELSAMPQSER